MIDRLGLDTSLETQAPSCRPQAPSLKLHLLVKPLTNPALRVCTPLTSPPFRSPYRGGGEKFPLPGKGRGRIRKSPAMYEYRGLGPNRKVSVKANPSPPRNNGTWLRTPARTQEIAPPTGR